MSQYVSKLAKSVGVVQRSIRVFPYISYLVNLFPIFCILFTERLIILPSSLLLISPFITSMATGFMYNTIGDAEKDPLDKNVITSRELSKKSAIYLSLLFCIISIVLFIFLFKSPFAILLSLFYLFAWFGYSGLKIRFKETYLAPIIASFVLWIGGPLILIVEFNYFNFLTICLLAGIFLCYTSFEINHTIVDYKIDKQYDCKTFAVRMGIKKALIIKHVFLALGNIVLFYGMLSFNLNLYFNLVFALILLLPQLLMIICDMRDYDLPRRLYKMYFFTSPYFMIKLLIISFGLIVLALPLEYIIVFFWVFIIDKNSLVI